MKMSEGPESFANFPEELVRHARGNLDFSLRLMHQDSRERAVREVIPNISDAEMRELDVRLEEIANMSFEDALKRFRDENFGPII